MQGSNSTSVASWPACLPACLLASTQITDAQQTDTATGTIATCYEIGKSCNDCRTTATCMRTCSWAATCLWRAALAAIPHSMIERSHSQCVEVSKDQASLSAAWSLGALLLYTFKDHTKYMVTARQAASSPNRRTQRVYT